MDAKEDIHMQSLDMGQSTEEPHPVTYHRNPRRCSPEDSVSLRPSLKREHRSEVQSNKAVADPQEQSPLLEERKRSSSQSSATGWFKRRNEKVEAKNDDLMQESPFFLDSHPTDSHSEPEEGRHPTSAWANGQFTSHDSENSDLRDVIDDLTVENKQLRERLKRYEKSTLSEMNRDKMFELRIHGLSSSKKRDLEQLLADFVTKNNVKGRRTPQAASSENNSSNIMSSTSNARSMGYKPGQSAPGDSGYASLSTGATHANSQSGLRSQSGPSSHTNSSQGFTRDQSSSKSRNNNVRSYLHNIPESLLPRVSPLMSERAKKKIVVQRLEYLFTGRSAAPGPHSQPMQQQEVSDSAAREDPYKSEGTREAPIMSHTKFTLERSPKHRQDSNSDASEDSPDHAYPHAGHKSPDQRPTRPLDLDIHRAQVPEDNMQYIRHLGLGSPTRHENETEGWVYLNLLMNMAQLHTLNVTPDFIKRAVSDMSERFELSPDGRKIRWKGGEDGTRLASDSSSRSDAMSGDSPDEFNASRNPSNVPSHDGFGSKHASLSSDALSSRPLPSRSRSGKPRQTDSMEASTSSIPLRSSRDSRFDYKPVVFRQQRSTDPSEDYMYPEYESQSGGIDDATHQSTPNYMSREGTISQRTSNAPIIFYNNAVFYTDMAGDIRAIDKAKAPVEGDNLRVLGVSDCNHIEQDSNWHQALPGNDVRPLSRAELENAKIQSLQLVPLSDATETPEHFQDFPVSGLGGVAPQDNFLIDVKTKHPTKLPARDETTNKKSYAVVSTKTTNLPTSRLPPPSYIFLTSSSSSNLDDEEFDSEDELTDSSLDENMPVPPQMLAQISSNSYEDGSEDNDEDSSIHMLHRARRLDPGAIDEGESSEYEELDGILPDELPAGSSAATAGGGSGYASGAESPMSMEMGPSSLKRRRSTVDSAIPTTSRSQKSPRMDSSA